MTRATFIAEYADFYDWVMGDEEAQDIIQQVEQQAQEMADNERG